MRKIISFAAALAVAAASFSTVASAESLRAFGVPDNDSAEVKLDIKTKWLSDETPVYGDHPISNPKRFDVGTTESFDSEATLDMTKVAEKWHEFVTSTQAAAYEQRNDHAALVNAVTLTGSYTLVIDADSIISNNGENTALNWKANAAGYNVTTYFEQDGAAVYNAADNTLTVKMKVKEGVNAALDTYFTALYNADAAQKANYAFVLDIDGSSADISTEGKYSVSGTFSGDVTIKLGDRLVSKVVFDETKDTEYIQVGADPTPTPYRRPSGGGGGSSVVTTPAPTATPTAKPFVAEKAEPLSDTIAEGYDSEETIAEQGAITGFVVDVTNSDGTDGVYGEDYTISDKDGHVLTPAEVNALLSNPDIILSDYNVNLTAGATAETKAIYKSGAQIDYNNHFAYIIGYPEGDVRPQNNISRAEVATIFFRLLTDDSRAEYWATSNSFKDVKSADWYNNAISTVANAGLVNGYEDGSFRPDAPITRAEFATIASRFASATGVIVTDFSDLSGHWSEAAVKKAASVGWVTGYEDGTFRPDKNILRAEAMAIVNRVTFRLVEKEGLHTDAIKWVDNPESAWYYAIVEEATNSHKYSRGAIGDNESWTEVTEHRDWSKLEKETSDKAAIIVGIENGALNYENNDGSIITEEK